MALSALSIVQAQEPPAAVYQSTCIDSCFTPQEECLPSIVNAIEGAKESIYVMAYYITQPPIVDALIKAHVAGVKVEIVMDRTQEKSRYSGLPQLKKSGIPCYIDTKGIRIQHNKVMIIDNELLLTGSYNWSRSAEIRNAENLLFIKHSPLLITKYKSYFVGRKKLSRRA